MQGYRRTTPKLNFPEFNGRDPRIWRRQCEDYFLFYNVPEHLRVTSATMHMRDNAGRWMEVQRLKGGFPSWAQFMTDVEDKFGAYDYDHAMQDLFTLKQTGSVEEFYFQFQSLQFRLEMHNSGFDRMFFINQFTRNLKPELAAMVQSHIPRTMEQAVHIAKIQEALFDRPQFKYSKPAFPHKAQFGISGRPEVKMSSTFNSPLTKERQKRDYCRANNLCFYCLAPFDPAHLANCPKRPKAQLNAVVVNDLDIPLTEDILHQLDMEDALSSEFGQLSLNALAGTDTGHTLKLRAMVKNKVMLTLVDSGSSHSFVSAAFLKTCGIPSTPRSPLTVKVANGELLVVDQQVHQLEWWIQGYTFYSDMLVLDFGAFDAILGYDWLAPLSPMICHWEDRTLDFQYRHQSVHLQGIIQNQSILPEVSPHELAKWAAGNDIAALAVIEILSQLPDA